MAFVKLDAAILRSTIWYKRPDLELFLAALLMAEPREYLEPVRTLEVDSLDDAGFVVPPGWYGFVPASGPGIIAQAVVNEVNGIAALKSLASPEKESRSQAHEGRRMVRIDGGYLILNYMKFRDMDHTAADRQRRLRARKAALAEGPVTRNTVTSRRDITHSREQMQKAESRKQNTENEAEWLASLACDPANAGVDVSKEADKCRFWCGQNRRQFTRKTFVNWLLRADRTIQGAGKNGGGAVPWQRPETTAEQHKLGF